MYTEKTQINIRNINYTFERTLFNMYLSQQSDYYSNQAMSKFEFVLKYLFKDKITI